MILFISLYSFITFFYVDLFINQASSNLLFSILSFFYYYSDYSDGFYLNLMIVYFLYDLCKLLYESMSKNFTFNFDKNRHYIYHHIYALLLCVLRCPEKYFLKQIQLCEFSSIVLNLHYFMENELKTAQKNKNNLFKFYESVQIKKMYQILFIIIFLYVRIYHVFINLLKLTIEHSKYIHFYEINYVPNQIYVWFNKEKYDNEFKFYVIDVIALVPFFCLHVIWIYKMFKKLYQLIKNNIL